MARTEDTEDIEFGDLRRGGDDSPPLMALVPDPPPSHWGKVTSQPRTMSAAYVRFLSGMKKESTDGRK
jgi:hypothetical protein